VSAANLIKDAAAVAAGSILFALAFALFFSPCGIVLGGAGGLAVTLHRLFSLPVGTGILLINLPLLFLSLFITRVRGLARTLIGVISTSVCTDLLSFLPAASREPMLAAVFGGLLMGISCAVLLPRGYTTGGTDLAAYMICRKFPRLRMSTVILSLDSLIVISSAALLQDFSGIFTSAAAIIACIFSLNFVSSGLRRAGLALIISSEHTRIASEITKKMNRGATLLRGTGCYTGEERPTVLCVVKRSEIYRLKNLVRELDPSAFLIIADAAEVLGHGFEGPDSG